ncbi:hypothetical protein CW304_18990 [Bacillus sp. UFRGS-B20]|nr:hypothetical protein CW304_18990 [Bacillus sp. UFRGS-B20]
MNKTFFLFDLKGMSDGYNSIHSYSLLYLPHLMKKGVAYVYMIFLISIDVKRKWHSFVLK